MQIFFADDCSKAVEVANKMAIQYKHGKGETQRHKFATIRSGYHGDLACDVGVRSGGGHEQAVCEKFAGAIFSPAAANAFWATLERRRY